MWLNIGWRSRSTVVERAAEVLAADGHSLVGARVIVVGVSYKVGVADVRESPALAIIDGLAERGADVGYHDPLVPAIHTPGGRLMRCVAAPSEGPEGRGWDLAVIHVLHPRTDDNRTDNNWIRDCPRVLDATYQFDGAAHRSVV